MLNYKSVDTDNFGNNIENRQQKVIFESAELF